MNIFEKGATYKIGFVGNPKKTETIKVIDRTKDQLKVSFGEGVNIYTIKIWGNSEFIYVSGMGFEKVPSCYAINVKSHAPIDLMKLSEIKVEGIDMEDYPKFCDAYISEAKYDGVKMTQSQLERLNKNGDFVYDEITKHIY